MEELLSHKNGSLDRFSAGLLQINKMSAGSRNTVFGLVPYLVYMNTLGQ